MATKSAQNVVSFLDRAKRKAPEMALDIPTTSARSEAKGGQIAAYAVPADRTKALLTIGSGQTGKSTLLRWIAERSVERGADTVMATLAPNRTLKHYFPETVYPEGNSTSAGAAFLELFFDGVGEMKTNAVMDFPGDDTALSHLLSQGIDPAAVLAEKGVELVVLYMLSPRVEDLTAMAQLAAKGFSAKATALVLNTGLTRDPTLPPEPEFDEVREHSAYRAAITAGAVEVWMPRLYSARAIENRRMLFGKARECAELGLSDRSRTHSWLQGMEAAFAPIAAAGWLP